MHKFELGQKVRCIITDFEGIITARCEYLTGCIQYCVTPKTDKKDQKYKMGPYLDEDQLVLVDKGIRTKPKEVKRVATGGPQISKPTIRPGRTEN